MKIDFGDSPFYFFLLKKFVFFFIIVLSNIFAYTMNCSSNSGLVVKKLTIVFVFGKIQTISFACSKQIKKNTVYYIILFVHIRTQLDIKNQER